MTLDNKDLEFGRDYVTYEDFGAVGDGKTEDFGAIYKTHEYANAHGLTVKGSPGKTYYICDTMLGTDKVHTVSIKTNVDWQGAHFIIDDTNIVAWRSEPCYEMAVSSLFVVEPESEHKVFRIEDKDHLEKIAAQGLNQKTKKIDLGIDWDGPVMIVPYNSAHGVFRRRGLSQFRGEPMHELIVIDKDGNVSEETPIMFSYAHIDYIDVYKLDPSTAITIENGVFTTLESRVNHYMKKEDGTFEYKYNNYIFRGMVVRRSYTTVKNVEHIATGGFTLLDRVERNLEGAMYGAFFDAEFADHVTFKDCKMQGRTSPGPGNGHSSYGFNAKCVNKIVLDGCVQSNFWVTVDPETYEVKSATVYDPDAIGHARRSADKNVYIGMGSVNVKGVERRLCWGIGGTNYCKNMEYINSTLTRFDAHAGLYHGKVINSNISCMAIAGYGDFIIENTNWHQYNIEAQSQLIYLRGDYGCHWSGDIKVKNVNGYMIDREKFYVTHSGFTNWYWGYTCAFPDISIDNMRFYDQETGEPLKPGYEARLFKFISNFTNRHLDDAKIPAVFAVVDEDGDGYIDEPRFISDTDGTFYPARDLDGDGKVGNTSLSYDEYMNAPPMINAGIVRPSHLNGAIHPTCTVNLNKSRPPKYFAVLNNKNENGEVVCKYVVRDTSVDGVSDGGWYRGAGEPDTMGGYFGGTRFVYGEGEDESFVGTKDKNGICDTFVFTEEYNV